MKRRSFLALLGLAPVAAIVKPSSAQIIYGIDAGGAGDLVTVAALDARGFRTITLCDIEFFAQRSLPEIFDHFHIRPEDIGTFPDTAPTSEKQKPAVAQ